MHAEAVARQERIGIGVDAHALIGSGKGTDHNFLTVKSDGHALRSTADTVRACQESLIGIQIQTAAEQINFLSRIHAQVRPVPINAVAARGARDHEGIGARLQGYIGKSTTQTDLRF